MLMLFDGHTRVARGETAEIAAAWKARLDKDPAAALLAFDAESGRVVDIDPRGVAPEPEARGRGRPKMGVVGREVTLLPRHWEWLGAQPGGASAALRRLVEQARRADAGAAERRAAREAAHRFLTAIGGDLPGYEAALRALYAGDRAGFDAAGAGWPADVREEALRLASAAWEQG